MFNVSVFQCFSVSMFQTLKHCVEMFLCIHASHSKKWFLLRAARIDEVTTWGWWGDHFGMMVFLQFYTAFHLETSWYSKYIRGGVKMFKMVENQWTLALKIQIQNSFRYSIAVARINFCSRFQNVCKTLWCSRYIRGGVKMLYVQILTRPPSCLKFGFALETFQCFNVSVFQCFSVSEF